MKRGFETAFDSEQSPTASIPNSTALVMPSLDLLTCFKSIDSTISVQTRNGHVPTWKSIQESFSNLCGTELTVDIFDPIAWYAADLYSIAWKDVPSMIPRLQLCIEMSAPASTINCGTVKLFTTENMRHRIEFFRYRFSNNNFSYPFVALYSDWCSTIFFIFFIALSLSLSLYFMYVVIA